MEQLSGKVTIVTGSASGIGASVVLGLAKRGAKVVVNYSKSEKEANATADAVGEQHGVSEKDLKAIAPRIAKLHKQFADDRKAGNMRFRDLPYDEDMIDAVKTQVEHFRDRRIRVGREQRTGDGRGSRRRGRAGRIQRRRISVLQAVPH